jgi:hypothetical protein
MKILATVAFIAFFVLPLTGAEKKPPEAQIEILNPKPETELSGVVELRLKITKEGKDVDSKAVYAGLGGPPWVRLSKVTESNEWKARLDSTMVPNQKHSLQIVTDNKRVRANVKVTVKNPLKVYFADLHSHTQYSDGMLLPLVAHDYAKRTAKLDVFSLTDHLESVDDNEWADTRFVAERATEEGKFVAIPGLEWTKKIGHVCIYDPKTRHWPKDLSGFYQAVADAGVTAKFNHPGDGSKVFDGMAYSEIGDKAIQLMEVRREQEEMAFIRALNQGWHIAPDGSDDTHSANWGNVRSWTGLMMSGLSRRNVLHALKNRQCYSTHDRNCELHFSINGHAMGTILNLKESKEIELDILVSDPDRADTIAKIDLFEDGKIVRSADCNVSSHRWTINIPSQICTYYYFVRVTQTDGNVLWSAPIWVKSAD